MEAYKSMCPDCGKTYCWIGYKTGIGKTPQELEKINRDHTVCKYCGSKKLKTELDDVGLLEALEERQEIQSAVDKAVRKLYEHSGDFVSCIVKHFQEPHPLEDRGIGTWYATLEAADWGSDQDASDEITIRFLVSPDKHQVPDSIKPESLRRKKKSLYRDFDQREERSADFIVIYTFAPPLSVDQNLELFSEFVFAKIKERIASLRSTDE